MAEVTNRIPLEEASDLLTRPGRACLSFVVDGRAHIEPGVVRHGDGRFLIGLAHDAAQPDPAAEVVLVVDEGVLFFDLRAVYVRGAASTAEDAGDTDHTWYEVTPELVSCWDYGRLRADDAGA